MKAAQFDHDEADAVQACLCLCMATAAEELAGNPIEGTGAIAAFQRSAREIAGLAALNEQLTGRGSEGPGTIVADETTLFDLGHRLRVRADREGDEQEYARAASAVADALGTTDAAAGEALLADVRDLLSERVPQLPADDPARPALVALCPALDEALRPDAALVGAHA